MPRGISRQVSISIRLFETKDMRDGWGGGVGPLQVRRSRSNLPAHCWPGHPQTELGQGAGKAQSHIGSRSGHSSRGYWSS